MNLCPDCQTLKRAIVAAKDDHERFREMKQRYIEHLRSAHAAPAPLIAHPTPNQLTR